MDNTRKRLNTKSDY